MSVEGYEPHVTLELIKRGHARRMNMIENYFAILQRQKLYRNFNLHAEFSQSLTREQLTIALRPIIMKYPLLAHTIIPKGIPDHDSFYRSNDYYNKAYPECDYIRVLDKMELGGILLNDQLEHKGISDEIIEQFIADNYNYTARVLELVGTVKIPYYHPERPNWRLLCLPCKESANSTNTLVLISNHCSMDGISCVNFFQDLAKNLNLPDSIQESTFTIFDYGKHYSQISKLPVPATDYIDYRPHNKELPRMLLSDLVKRYLNYQSEGIRTQIMSDDEMQTYHHILNFSVREIEMLKLKIKSSTRNESTLTPFLQACFVVALQRYGKFFKKRCREWGFDVSVIKNIRNTLPESAAVRDRMKYGCNIGSLHRSYLISSFDIAYNNKKKFWLLVEHFHDLLRKNPRAFLISAGLLMIDQIAEYKNIDKLIMDDYMNKKRGGALISNLGYHPQCLTERYHIKDLTFSQTPGSIKFAFGMNVASTNEKGMNIDLSIVRTAISDRPEWMAFCDEFRKVVRTFTSI